MNRLTNKVAIITGAAGGQGAAEAKLFAQEGAKVVATDVNHALLMETVKEINDALGSECVVGFKRDIASETDWVSVVERAVQTFGKIDILINNAAIPGRTSGTSMLPRRRK